MLLVIRLVDTIVDVLVSVVLLAMMGFGIYALWDEQNIYQGAEASIYEIFHPATQDSDGADGLAELRKWNPDVVAWLKIDDTQIDYPVVQGEDNLRYVNTDVFGEYSLSGSIFLDYRNTVDFSNPKIRCLASWMNTGSIVSFRPTAQVPFILPEHGILSRLLLFCRQMHMTGYCMIRI